MRRLAASPFRAPFLPSRSTKLLLSLSIICFPFSMYQSFCAARCSSVRPLSIAAPNRMYCPFPRPSRLILIYPFSVSFCAARCSSARHLSRPRPNVLSISPSLSYLIHSSHDQISVASFSCRLSCQFWSHRSMSGLPRVVIIIRCKSVNWEPIRYQADLTMIA